MAPVSSFYFDARLKGKDYIQGVPMFAIHVGENIDFGWSSAGVTANNQWQPMMWRIDRTVGVYLAMPRVYASQFFTKDRHWDEVIVGAFRPMQTAAGDNYLSGTSVALKFSNVMVVGSSPIMQWKGLPIPPQVQKNFLEKKIGRETYIPTAVKLMVQEGDAIS